MWWLLLVALAVYAAVKVYHSEQANRDNHYWALIVTGICAGIGYLNPELSWLELAQWWFIGVLLWSAVRAQSSSDATTREMDRRLPEWEGRADDVESRVTDLEERVKHIGC